MYDEYDFTLEDAMNAVDEYIEERAVRGAHKKLLASRANKIDAISDRIVKLHTALKTTQNSKLKKTLSKKIDDLKSEREALNSIIKVPNPNGGYVIYDQQTLNKIFNGPEKHTKSQGTGRDILVAMKRELGVKPNTYTPPKPNEFLNAQKALHESVNDRVLDVCDAYEEGIINDEEFDMMLEMLDLENYE